MIQHLTEIVEEARKRGKKRLAVAYGQDSHTLEAVYEAYKEGLVEPTLFGDKEVIKQVCQENGIDINAFNIVNEPNDVKCVQQAVASVVSGNADVLMKGLVSTDKYMRGILNKEAGLFPPKGVLSHVSIVEMPCYHKLLIISDVAVIPLPDFKQKMVQIGYLARTANLLGIATPKIACIAPSEQLLPNVISSTEGALLAKMADRGQLGNVVVDGPLSLDVALYKEVAEHKKVKGSSVAGDPDCLLFPNLESANVFFKSVSHLCGGELAAMVMGTKVPCVLTSRGDTSKTKLFSIALACLGTNSVIQVMERIAQGDQRAKKVLDAMCYNIVKQIGAMAAALSGSVQAIVLTGGIAYNEPVVEYIRERCSFIAPIAVYPGENELEALVTNALVVLRGVITPKVYK